MRQRKSLQRNGLRLHHEEPTPPVWTTGWPITVTFTPRNVSRFFPSKIGRAIRGSFLECAVWPEDLLKLTALALPRAFGYCALP